mmetsp:Transcript_15336/g.39479  ORF Transcript_15336/g.39479 Transcript_15336/m.39479 type:complete len:203 (+) Transcript_15336:118-726(+)
MLRAVLGTTGGPLGRGLMAVQASLGAATAVPATLSAQLQLRAASAKAKRKPNRKPRITLKMIKSVHKVGVKGEVVKVKRGFARNYLIPQGVATYYTIGRPVAGDVVDTEGESALEESREAEASRLVDAHLRRSTLMMYRQEGNEWAIDAAMLVDKCGKQLKLAVPPERVVLNEPLVTYGRHDIPVWIDEEHPSTLRVEVLRR